MKTKSILLAAVAVMSLAACHREPVGPVEKEFTAGFQTKTSVAYDEASNKYAISWEAGDQVSIFDGEANNVFTAKEAGLSTTLTGQAKDANTYYALYPYAANAALNGAVISTAIPASAALTADGSAHFANISVAKTSGTTLSFATVVGMIKFTLGAEATGIKEIHIKAVGGETLAGSASIDMSGNPVLSIADGVSSITVTPASGNVFETGHSYYVAAAPATLASGIALEFVTANGKVTKTQEKALTISAGKVMNIGVINSIDDVPEPIMECPYRHEFANGDFGIGPIFDWGGWEDGYYFDMLTNPDVLSGATWNITDTGYYEWAGTEGWRKGIQLGTGNMTVSNFALSSTSFPGVITSITLGYNSGITDGQSLVASCTVGNAVFGAPVAHGDGDYEAVFNGSASGDIVITLNSTTKGAVYLYYLYVEYDPDGTPVEPGDDREETAGFQDLTGENYDVQW